MIFLLCIVKYFKNFRDSYSKHRLLLSSIVKTIYFKFLKSVFVHDFANLLRSLCLLNIYYYNWKNKCLIKCIFIKFILHLLGHEFPFSIKMNFIRELLRHSEFDLRNLNSISTDAKCYFILRKNTLNSSIRVGEYF